MNGPNPTFNPFPGLRPFWSHEKHLFFGREAQIAEMLHRLGQCRFLAAVGPSGSGKSSLVRAGLIPELHGGIMARAGSHWEVLVLRPGGNPLGNLAAALAESALYEPDEDLVLQIETTLGRSARGLCEAVRQSGLPPRTNVLVVVDQFEEIFRFRKSQVSQREWADAFVNLLLEATRQEALPIYVLLTMRSDFLGDCAQFRGLAEAINAGSYLIPRLTREQWRAAIEGPVRVGGGSLAPRLVQRLLNDVGDNPDQLPILQHALMRTWEYWSAHHQEQGPIDLAHYEAVGGMADALSRHADEVFDELPGDAHRRIAEKAFKALAEKGSDNRGVRHPARLAELGAVIEAPIEDVQLVVERFRQAGRTFLMPPAEVKLESDTVIDISHESLMRVWQRMNRWVETESRSARVYRRLAETALLWKQGKAGLFRNPDLQIALLWRQENEPNAAWAERYGGGLEVALEFLEESRRAFEAEEAAREAARQRELEQARALAETQRLRAEEKARAARRLRVLVLFLAMLVVVTIIAAVYANQEKRIGYSRELSARARSVLDVGPERSVLFAAKAATRSPDVMPIAEARDVLRQALIDSHQRRKLSGHTDVLNQAVFSPDGRAAVTASDDGTAILWDLTQPAGAASLVLTGHTAQVKSAAFSSDGRRVVTASHDNRAIVWEGPSWKSVREFNHPEPLHHAAFSPDGGKVVTACDDGFARVWDVATGTVTPLVPGHTNSTHTTVFKAMFSPDGKWIVTAGKDATARIWDAGSFAFQTNLAGHTDSLVHLAFSPDGRRVATASTDRSARLWSITGELLATMAHGDEVRSVAFSSDGRFLVTASHDRTAQIWRLSDAEPRLHKVLSGHSAGLEDARFSPDGRFVATAAADTTARLWDTDEGNIVAVLRGHEKPVNTVAFDATGQFILTASRETNALVWESPAWRNVTLGTNDPAPEFTTAALSRDGSLVATATETGLVELWNATNGLPHRSQTNDVSQESRAFGSVRSLAFSPDDRFVLVTVREPGPVVIWDLSGRELPVSLGWASNRVNHAAFSSDGELVLLTLDRGSAQVWERKSTNLVAVLTNSPDLSPIERGAFSPNGRLVAVANNNEGDSHSTVWIWDRTSGARISTWQDRLPPVASIVFGPAGDGVLVGCEDGAARLWDSRFDRPPRVFKGHSGKLSAADFSPDGHFVVTASSVDRTVCLWSVETAQLLATLRGHSGAVLRVGLASSPKGLSVASVGENRRLIRFFVEECGPDGELPRLTRERLQLTPDELTQRLRELVP